jgi:hypothetical protein
MRVRRHTRVTCRPRSDRVWREERSKVTDMGRRPTNDDLEKAGYEWQREARINSVSLVLPPLIIVLLCLVQPTEHR